MSECTKFSDIYKGTVINNVDPQGQGRLLIEVPDVLKLMPTTWAEPVVPLSGATGSSSGVYMVPPIGAGVWVQFVQGDPNHPVWVGCRWGAPTDIPTIANLGNPVSPPVVIQSMGQQMIMISDSPMPGLPAGGILLTTGASYVQIDKTGVTIFGATIKINGTLVNINGGALTIT